MANGRKVVAFNSFAAGDYGLAGEHNAPQGSYTGKNVQVYVDGSIGPRCGIKDMGVVSTPVGDVLGFGQNPSQDKVWAIIGNHAYQFATEVTGSTIQTLSGTLSSTPTERVRSAESHQFTYIASYGDKCYSLDHPGNAVAALTGSPDGRVIAIYGEFLMVGSPAAQGDLVRFSAPGDFNSWPAPNYFPTGSGYEVILLTPQRQYLTIAKHDGSWWVLSGTPGISDYLRRIIRAYPLGVGEAVTRWGSSGDGTIWAVARRSLKPVIFNGSAVREIETQEIGGTDEAFADTDTIAAVGVTGLKRPTDAFFVAAEPDAGPSSGRGLLLHRSIWSKHEFETRLSGWIDGRLQPRVYMAEGRGQGGGAGRFYAWEYELDRPPRYGEVFESIGDASDIPVDAEFTMPEWWANDEEQVRPRQIIVDFKKFGHGFSADNALTIEYTPLRRFNEGPGTTESSAWSEAQSAAALRGTQDRFTMNPAAQWANGFRVGISGLVGCAIQKIHVILETQPTPGTA